MFVLEFDREGDNIDAPRATVRVHDAHVRSVGNAVAQLPLPTLLKRTPLTDKPAAVKGDVTPTTTAADDEADRWARIRCPKCRWQPTPATRWCCRGGQNSPEPAFPGCGELWNTFETRGRCPFCFHHWRYTACLNCSAWSLHEDWYEPSTSTP